MLHLLCARVCRVLRFRAGPGLRLDWTHTDFEMIAKSSHINSAGTFLLALFRKVALHWKDLDLGRILTLIRCVNLGRLLDLPSFILQRAIAPG